MTTQANISLIFALLKKITSIFFLTLYLFSTTEANELLKLPVIFQHYAEHQQEDKSISFLQFLDIHYMHGSPKDKDYERDMQLPFKTPTQCISSIVPEFVPLMPEISIDKPIELSENKKSFPKTQFILSSYLSNIWQPPKSC